MKRIISILLHLSHKSTFFYSAQLLKVPKDGTPATSEQKKTSSSKKNDLHQKPEGLHMKRQVRSAPLFIANEFLSSQIVILGRPV